MIGNLVEIVVKSRSLSAKLAISRQYCGQY